MINLISKEEKMKKITAVLCAVLLVGLMLTACGGGKYADSKYLGKWSATKAEYAGIEMGVEEIRGGEFSFTLDESGKVTLKVVDEEETGKWEETDNGIIFDDDDKMTFEDKDGVLVMDYQGVTLTFEKAE